MEDFTAILRPDGIYHVYNRAVGSDRLFITDANRDYFLQRYAEWIAPIADTFAFCLMPNHFHFLLRFKGDQQVLERFLRSRAGRRTTLTGFKTLSGFEQERLLSAFISQQFSHLFNGYTQAFNRQQDRHGSLFSRPFQRKVITGDRYLQKVILYIHFNPVSANLCERPSQWRYSSYNALRNGGNTVLARNEVLEWFDGQENFNYCHDTYKWESEQDE